ncbi:MAG: GAP family protein [Gaiellales bacterium]
MPLALAGAISPLVLLGALVLLTSPSHRLLRCGMFALGLVVMTALFFGIGYLALRLDLGGVSGTKGALSSTTSQYAMAAALLITAVWFFWKAPSEETQEKWLNRINDPRVPAIAYFGVGIVMSWFSASFIVIIAILHRLSIAGLPLSQNVVLLVIAIAISSLPATVPFVAELVGGPHTRERLEALGAWMFRNGRFILGGLFVLMGLRDLIGALGL